MTAHFLAFADALGLTQVDLLGFSLGGMVAQQAALERPSLVRRMLLVGTAPEGGEDIMHLEKPELRQHPRGSQPPGYQVLVKLFFTPSESSQAAGQAFVSRLAAATEDREPLSGPEGRAGPDRGVSRVGAGGGRAVRQAPRDHPADSGGERGLRQHDSGQKFLCLAEHLPRAMLLTYPDAGHGSLFQYHESFVRQASLFLDSEVL